MMEDGMANYAEYRVSKVSKPIDVIMRIGLIFSWILIALAPVLIGLSSTSLTGIIWIFPVTAALAVPFGRHTFRMTYIEYEYAVVSGVMRFDIINGASKRKPWFEVRIGDMTLLAPFQGGYKMQAEQVMEDKNAKVYFAVSSLESPDIYVGIYRNEKGEECIVLFEAINKMLKIAKFYNRNTVVEKVRF